MSSAQHRADPIPVSATASTNRADATYLPGREADARVARIVFALATGGRARCGLTRPTTGIVLQHLSQFRIEDRAGLIATETLDRGPEVIVVVPGSPADRAGLRPGDVLLSVSGEPLPPEGDRALPFEPERAHARADAVEDILERGAGPFDITVLRGDITLDARLAPLPACPSRVVLARSGQRNAYADGTHVFLTTGLLAGVRSDDELAFIVAHEMAHNILRHAVIMRSGAVHRGLGRTFGQSGWTIRETERAADALGGELMLDAGLDPALGALILKRMDGTDLGVGLFATHDPADRRTAAMRALVEARKTP